MSAHNTLIASSARSGAGTLPPHRSGVGQFVKALPRSSTPPGGLVFGHLTIAGHNQAATLIWPKVQSLLQ